MLLSHSYDSRAAMQIANREAEAAGSERISVAHLLLGLAQCGGTSAEVLSSYGLSADLIRQFYSDQNDESNSLAAVIGLAMNEVGKRHHIELDSSHLLFAILESKIDSVEALLVSAGCTLQQVSKTTEDKLPNADFPLDDALRQNLEHPIVTKLKTEIDELQNRIESLLKTADFETAALHRDNKREKIQALTVILRDLWNSRNTH